MRVLAAVSAAILLVALLGASAGGALAQDHAATERFHVVLHTDGDASWNVTVSIELDSPSERAGFDRLATDYEAGDSDVLSIDPYERAAEGAESVTGRNMTIRDSNRSAWRSNGTGTLALTFEWTAFAEQSGDRLLLGDVFQTPDGTWLPGLDANQTLLVEFPPEYVVVDSSHKLKDRAFAISGPTTFDPGSPAATLVRGQTTTTVPGTTTTSGGTPVTTTSPANTTTTAEPPSRSDWDLVGIAAIVILVGTLAILVERRRRTDAGAVTADGGDGGPSGGEAAASGATDGAAAAGATDQAVADEDEPLLSDDERVLRLLHEHGGRMKQGRIVEETGWSNAKVSQLLSEMAERDQLDKLRIGRENLISLPDRRPDDE